MFVPGLQLAVRSRHQLVALLRRFVLTCKKQIKNKWVNPATFFFFKDSKIKYNFIVCTNMAVHRMTPRWVDESWRTHMKQLM